MLGTAVAAALAAAGFAACLSAVKSGSVVMNEAMTRRTDPKQPGPSDVELKERKKLAASTALTVALVSCLSICVKLIGIG